MSNNQSLADDMVIAIGAAKRIGESVDNDHPMRHQVRNMKEMAFIIMSNAAFMATSLAYQAEQLIKDYDEAQKFVNPSVAPCLHSKKVRQSTGNGIFFWYCPECKIQVDGD